MFTCPTLFICASPTTVPLSAGIPASRLAETIIAPFNRPELVEGILDAHEGEIAAMIVEPVQFNIGVVPPEPGFLERLRELDQVAYVRFASVYRKFEDIDAFMDELKTLLQKQG